jgi:hypothetical protein
MLDCALLVYNQLHDEGSVMIFEVVMHVYNYYCFFTNGIFQSGVASCNQYMNHEVKKRVLHQDARWCLQRCAA